MRALLLAVRETAKLFGTQRKLWLPFLCTACVEILLLGPVWLAPQPPFSEVLAPPIRFFFGDRVLHYPAHLWFLYHVTRHAYIVSSIFVGAYMTGVACSMVGQIHTGTPLSLRDVLINRQVHYGRVLLVWIISWGIATGLVEGLARIVPKTTAGLLLVVSATIILQVIFSYAVPAAVFRNSKWWKAILQSVQETIRHPFSTLVVVAFPTLGVIALAILVPPTRVANWMSTTQPEIAVACVAVRILMWTVADAVLTVAVAHLWWAHRILARVPSPAIQAVSAKDPRVSTPRPLAMKKGPAIAS